MLGLTLGMLLCEDPWHDYAEEVFSGMANRIAAVTIIAWSWAGMFTQGLRDGGLVAGGHIMKVGGALDAIIERLTARAKAEESQSETPITRRCEVQPR